MADVEISEHLASAIERRRIELGYTPTGLAAATGLSLQALKNIRHGEVRRYQERLTLPLTRELGWTSDSISRLLAGQDPVVASVEVDGEVETIATLAAKVKQLVARDDARQIEMKEALGEIRRLGDLVRQALLDDDAPEDEPPTGR